MHNPRRALWIAASLAVLAGCGHAAKSTRSQPSPATGTSAAPSPSAVPAATQRPAPVGVKKGQAPAPAPSGTGTSAPAAAATALPLAARKVPRLPPDAPPQILDVQISETVVSPGDSVEGDVVTSSNVASVEARIGGYAVSLRKTGVGRFALTYRVGPLPWFVHGNFTMQVIARNARGTTTAREIPLTVR